MITQVVTKGTRNMPSMSMVGTCCPRGIIIILFIIINITQVVTKGTRNMPSMSMVGMGATLRQTTIVPSVANWFKDYGDYGDRDYEDGDRDDKDGDMDYKDGAHYDRTESCQLF
jgi:hypothetical protein